MKTKIKYIVFLLFIIVLASCKKPNHYVRVQNQDTDTLIKTTVGINNYGVLAPGQYSGYEHVPEGTLPAFAESESNGNVQSTSGNVSVYGHGTHYWTVVVDYYG